MENKRRFFHGRFIRVDIDKILSIHENIYNQNQTIRLEAELYNQSYQLINTPEVKINLKNEKLPYLDKLVYLIVGDTNNEILKFEAKETDVLSIRGANVARYKLREADSDYSIYNLGADTGTLFLVFNLNNRKNTFTNKFYHF